MCFSCCFSFILFLIFSSLEFTKFFCSFFSFNYAVNFMYTSFFLICFPFFIYYLISYFFIFSITSICFLNPYFLFAFMLYVKFCFYKGKTPLFVISYMFYVFCSILFLIIFLKTLSFFIQ